jgi:hypothetical protein
MPSTVVTTILLSSTSKFDVEYHVVVQFPTLTKCIVLAPWKKPLIDNLEKLFSVPH